MLVVISVSAGETLRCNSVNKQVKIHFVSDMCLAQHGSPAAFSELQVYAGYTKEKSYKGILHSTETEACLQALMLR